MASKKLQTGIEKTDGFDFLRYFTVRNYLIKYFRLGDIIIVLLVIAIGFSPMYLHKNGSIKSFSIILDSAEIASIPADTDTTIIVPAPLGAVKIEISGGRARVVESSCPRKICVHSGAIGKAGQAIACVPNKLIIIAVGDERSGKYDAILK